MWERTGGKRVVITSRDTGIGWSIAEMFLEAGAHVHICGLGNANLEVCGEMYPQIGAPTTDVAGPAGLIETIGIEDWSRTQDVTVQRSFYCLHQAIPLPRWAGEGSGVDLSSTTGMLGYPLRTLYAAAKWAIVGPTGHGIRGNVVCPGSVYGDRMARATALEAEARGDESETVE